MNGYKIHIDFLRITACFLVVVNHTNSRLFMGNPPSPVWFISVFLFYISKTAVPLFIMISGSLLLGREDSYRNIFRRILRIAAALFVFSGFYFLISIKDFKEITGTELKNFFITVYSGAVTNAFWYLYLYIGLLLMLPLLQKMIHGFNKADFIYFLCFSALATFTLPVITDFFDLPVCNSTVITPLFNGYLAYFIAGYYIDNLFIRKSKRCFITAAALFFVFTLFSVIMTYFEFKKNTAAYPYWDNRLSFNIMIPGICLFYMMKYLSDIDFGLRTETALKILGSCTFGIYLLSDMLILAFEPMYVAIYPYIGRLPAVAILISAVISSGLIMVCHMKKLPFLKALI